MAYSRYDLFVQSIDNDKVLSQQQKDALKSNFLFLVKGLLASMNRTSYVSNGKYFVADGSEWAKQHGASSYAKSQNAFLYNLSEIATNKFFGSTQTVEPLVFYTNTSYGPEGDLLQALSTDCKKIRDFMGSNDYKGLKLPRFDSKKSEPDYKDKHCIESGKFFYALTREGQLLTVSEYNDYMFELLKNSQAKYGYFKALIFINLLMNRYDASVEQESGSIYNLENRHQEILFRLNHAMYQSLQTGKPLIFEIEDNKAKGDLLDIISHSYLHSKVAELFKIIKDENYSISINKDGKERFTAILDREAFYNDLEMFNSPEIWKDLKIISNYTDEQIKAYQRAVKLLGGKVKKSQKVASAKPTEKVVKKVSTLTTSTKQISHQKDDREKEKTVLKTKQRVSASKGTINLKPLKVQVVGPTTQKTIMGRDLSKMSPVIKDLTTTDLFKQNKRNLLLSLLGETNAKALSVVDNVLLNYTSEIAKTTDIEDDNITFLYQSTFLYNLYELAYSRVQDGKTLNIGFIDGIETKDLQILCEKSNNSLAKYMEKDEIGFKSQKVGSLQIIPDEGDIVPVGSITISKEGITLTKPKTQSPSVESFGQKQ